MPDHSVAIVIPVYDGAALTKQCLDTLIGQNLDAQIIVVDDASGDETATLLEAYGDAIRSIRNPRNRGYAYTCNRGAELSDADYVVFLNNDTVPHTDWLDALVRDADAHPEAAMFGSRLLFGDGSVQHAGVAFNQGGMPYHIYAGFPATHPAVMRAREMQAVTAACVLIRGAVFKELNGFDEGFNNSSEDIDLCLRAGELGHRVRYVPASVLTHYETATRGRFGDYLRQNNTLWTERWLHKVRRDDLELLSQDGLLRATYRSGNRLHLEVDPIAGDASEGGFTANEEEIDRMAMRWLDALDAGGSPHRLRPRGPAPVGFSSDGDARHISDVLAWSEAVAEVPIQRAAAYAHKVAPLRLAPARRQPQRINVLYEGLSEGALFGGHAAMLQLAAMLSAAGNRVRIIAVDQAGTPSAADWRAAADLPGTGSLTSVEYLDAFDRSIPVAVSDNDRFIATSWWTMHIAHDAVTRLGAPAPLWLQQEWEPVFYPTGSFHAGARAAYALPHSALFSSGLLQRYFENQGIGVFAPECRGEWAVFENPLTHPGPVTAATLRRRRPHRLLVYLRHAPRNLLEVTYAALELADASGVLPADWTITGVGGDVAGRPRVHLSSGRPIELFERVTSARYMALLSGHDAGVALQDSPHPGLVALDMAGAGLTAVTSVFAPTKTSAELKAISANIIGTEPEPHAVAEAIGRAVVRTADVEARAAGSSVNWARSADEAFSEELCGRVLTMLAR